MKRSFSLRSMVLAVCALAISFQASLLQAQSGTWTANAAGNWGAAPNWLNDIVADGQNSTAFLSDVINANRTITLDFNRTIGNIFAQDLTHNYTISGANVLTLDVSSGLPVIDVVTGRTLTIGSVIDGTVGLQKDGPGTLALTGATTYTGGNTITGGTLSVNSVAKASIGNGPLSLSGGGFLSILSTNVSSSSQVSVGTGGGSIAVNGNNNFTTTGILTGSGTLTHATPGGAGGRSLNFNSTANDFTGGIIINGLIAQIFQVNSLVDSANNIAFTRATGAGTGTFRYGTGAITALTLTNRAFELNGGDAIIGVIENSNTTHAITINSNLLATGNGAKTLGLAGGNATPNNVFAGVIADETDGGTGTVALSKTGNSRWALTNANNSYTGSTTIAGILEVTKLSDGAANSSIGASSNAATNLLLGNAATLHYTGTGDSTDRSFTLNGTANGHAFTLNASGSGAVNFTSSATPGYGTANQTRTLNLRGTETGANTLAAALADNGTGAVSVTKLDAGTWVLAGASSNSGLTTISGGTLVLSGSNSSGGATTINGATLQLNSASNGGLANGTLTLSQNAGVLQAVNADRTISNAVLLNASPTISGSQSLTIDGIMTVNNNRILTNDITSGNRLTLASIERDAANNRNFTHAGTGTTVVDGNITLGTGTLNVNGGTLLINGTTSTGAVSVSAGATLGGDGIIGNAVTFTGASFLSPGNSPGQLTMAGLTLADLTTTTMELGGTTLGTLYDNVTINEDGALGYNGFLDVVNFGAFDMDLGSFAYDLFAFSGTTSPTGDFSTVTVNTVGLTNDGFGVWTGSNGSDVDYTFTQSTGNLVITVVPEPGTLALLAGGAVAGVALLRRRRNNSV